MTGWNEKRVSIIIMTYNNWRIISRSLDSVFAQDHPNIEIIVSDDGTRDFDPDYVRGYIEENAGKNIQSVHILHSEENTGTVQNLRRGLAAMTGDYYMNMGADDALADPKVMTSMLRYAAIYKWESLAITGQLVMCDADLKQIGVALDEQDKAVLKTRNADLLFSRLMYRCCIATVATMYRRDFPEIVDAYDTAYRYYEDYPTFVRMARKGITPLFIDRKIALHAGGGIANGGSHKNEAITRQFHADRELLYRKELKPHLKTQSRRVKTLLAQRRDVLQKQFLWELWKIYNSKQRKTLILSSPWTLYWSLGKGIAMRDKLTKIGLTCLVLGCAARASGLLFGPLEAVIEIGCAAVGVGGIAVYVGWHIASFVAQCRKIWQQALLY